MLYRWLNGGKPPFVGASEVPTRAALEDARARRLTGERPPLPGGPGVDSALAAIVLKAVEPQPQDRWSTAAQMGEALQAWLDRGAPQAPAPVRGGDARASVSIPAELAAAGGGAAVSYVAGGQPRTLQMAIPAGTANGAAFKLVGYGEPGLYGGAAGDLIVTVALQPAHEPVVASKPAVEEPPVAKGAAPSTAGVIATGVFVLSLFAVRVLFGGGLYPLALAIFFAIMAVWRPAGYEKLLAVGTVAFTGFVGTHFVNFIGEWTANNAMTPAVEFVAGVVLSIVFAAAMFDAIRPRKNASIIMTVVYALLVASAVGGYLGEGYATYFDFICVIGYALPLIACWVIEGGRDKSEA